MQATCRPISSTLHIVEWIDRVRYSSTAHLFIFIEIIFTRILKQKHQETAIGSPVLFRSMWPIWVRLLRPRKPQPEGEMSKRFIVNSISVYIHLSAYPRDHCCPTSATESRSSLPRPTVEWRVLLVHYAYTCVVYFYTTEQCHFSDRRFLI